MKTNVSIPLGGIVLIDKVDKRFGVFKEIFSGVAGKTKDFIECVKLHIYNKLTYSVSTHQILEAYSQELAPYLGLKKLPAERSLYRTFERIGRCFPVVHGRYQNLVRKHGLVDEKQTLDYSSTYFEGGESELGARGYSRDHRPDRLQVNFGISTGLNGIPTALTIQRGNVQDKKHMKEMISVVSKVLSEGSLLIFDCGGNTKANKMEVRGLDFHYLTFKAKKVSAYRKFIQYFNANVGDTKHFDVNGRQYVCVKKTIKGETHYVFFCPQLCEDQLKAKEKRFVREKKKAGKLLKRKKPVRLPSEEGWVMLTPPPPEDAVLVRQPLHKRLGRVFHPRKQRGRRLREDPAVVQEPG